MALIDLKPLTKEMIQERDLNPHDLWVVKVNEEVYGPFELAPLKEVVAADIDNFEEAQASRVNVNFWESIFNHAPFQYLRPKSFGPFWLIKDGLKSGPFGKKEINKRITEGSLGITDVVSLDEGMSWHKLFEMEGFTHHLTDASKLPFSPSQDEFDKSKLHVLNIIEFRAGRLKAGEELAVLAHQKIQSQARAAAPKVEDLPVLSSSDVPVSSSLKWIIPVAVLSLGLIMTGSYFFLGEDAPETVEVSDAPASRSPSRRMASRPLAPEPPSNPQYNQMPQRNPASAPQFTPPPQPEYHYTRDSQYPTHTETHHPDQGPAQETEMLDARTGDVVDDDQQRSDPQQRSPAEEHSLVNKAPAPDDQNGADDQQSLDAAMNGSQQPERPVVEEASDF